MANSFRPLAAFSGLKNVPLVATSHNSLYPSLTVDAAGVTIVVVRTHRFTWEDIETIEAGWMFGHMITLVRGMAGARSVRPSMAARPPHRPCARSTPPERRWRPRPANGSPRTALMSESCFKRRRRVSDLARRLRFCDEAIIGGDHVRL